MRFSRFWCIRSFKATWKTSSSFKESLNASVGSEPKIYVEIHGPYIYICFLFIGIVRNCDQLEVTCLTCFLVVIPERSRGGHFQRKVAFLFARNDGVDTGRATNLPCAKTANPTGKMVSGPPIEIASCWWMKNFIEKQFKNHTLLETQTLSLKIEGWVRWNVLVWAAISA